MLDSKNLTRSLSRIPILILGVLMSGPISYAEVPTPGFAKFFAPGTIGPGSVSTLQFDITNSDPVNPVGNLAFSDTLPAGVTIASPANAFGTCGGTLTAPDGGSTIIFTGGMIGASASCSITVDVTSSTPGTHMNASGNLTSDAGNSGSASADLTVATDRPGFSKSFAPDMLPLGGRSTLTFTIDNTANPAIAFNISFSDTLPSGIEIAGPANGSITCTGGVLTAVPGTAVISYGPLFAGDASVAAMSSCTVSVDVIGSGAGLHVNVSSEMTSIVGMTTRSSGKASDALEVTVDAIALTKSFTDDPVPPGGTVTLRFRILNFSRLDPAVNIEFTDNLDAALSGLAAIAPLPTDPCGAGSTLSGVGFLTLSGGNLPPAGSCTFSVVLQVPAGASSGVFTNTTSSITADIGAASETGSPASDDLFVQPVPVLTKEFIGDPVSAGDSVIMRFTIANTSTTSGASDIAFIDELTTFFPFPVMVTLPATPCGAGSSIALVILGTERQGLELTNGVLSASGMADDSCTFDVTLDVPVGQPGGTYLNTTEPITATVDAMTLMGAAASDDFVVLGAPRLVKEFTDDPVIAGGAVTLEFTISHDENATSDATGIAFSDDLTVTLAGLTATGLPMNDVCGAGSQISGTTNLSFAGGTLAPGESCTFGVVLQTPAGAFPGDYPNTTSDVTAVVSGEAVTGLPAQDDLQIAALSFTKSFLDDPPIIPGATVTLEFAIENLTVASDATNIAFSDNLNDALSGLAAVAPLPAMPCGPMSQITGTSSLIFFGGELTAGTSCTFSVTLLVPAGAPNGSFGNTTSSLTATIEEPTVVVPPATDVLDVSDEFLELAKEFTDDPVSPGGTVTLEFTITNLDPANPVSNIAFSDNLNAALSGLAAVGLPLANACNGSGTLSGTGLLSFSGGSLAAGASCSFSATLSVPAAVSLGTVVTNTTSQVTGEIGGLAVTGSPASDDLRIDFLAFTKAFGGLTTAGGAPVLTFTITNLDATSDVDGLGFSDNLNAVIAGLSATGLPAAGVCGPGSSLAGTSLLTLTAGNLGPGATCMFNATLQVPGTAVAGTFPNTTSDLLLSGIPAGNPATASLTVEPPPTFAKVFAPDSIGLGQVSVLTLTIDNSASALAANSLDFTDNLPAGVAVSNPSNAATTCSGGTLTAASGSGVIAYSGGSVAAGDSCFVQVDVSGNTVGAHVNTTGDLTSSSGSSGSATDTLTVNPQPAFSKAFAPNPIPAGGVSTLTFTTDNSGSTVAANSLSLTDNLPAAVTLASPVNAATDCIGGTLTAASGTSVVSYSGGTVSAASSCTIGVDVTSSTAGMHVNTTGDLTSSLGNSGAATDTLNVVSGEIEFTKAFVSSGAAVQSPVVRSNGNTNGKSPDTDPVQPSAAIVVMGVLPGGFVDLSYTITNTSSVFSLTDIAFTDDLDAVIPGLVAVGLPAADICGAGSQISGTSLLSLSDGSLGPSASCTFQVTLQVPGTASTGSFPSTSSPITALLGGVPVMGAGASATLPVIFFDLSKRFDPALTLAGGLTSLQFTISNPDLVNSAGGITLTDDLGAVIPGLAAVGLPLNDVCGAGSQIDGTTLLTLTGGSLGPGETCTFSVNVQIPANAPRGTFTNITSPLQALVNGEAVTGDPATAAQSPLTVGVEEIPTLNEYGLLLLAGLLTVLAWRRLA